MEPVRGLIQQSDLQPLSQTDLSIFHRYLCVAKIASQVFYQMLLQTFYSARELSLSVLYVPLSLVMAGASPRSTFVEAVNHVKIAYVALQSLCVTPLVLVQPHKAQTWYDWTGALVCTHQQNSTPSPIAITLGIALPLFALGVVKFFRNPLPQKPIPLRKPSLSLSNENFSTWTNLAMVFAIGCLLGSAAWCLVRKKAQKSSNTPIVTAPPQTNRSLEAPRPASKIPVYRPKKQGKGLEKVTEKPSKSPVQTSLTRSFTQRSLRTSTSPTSPPSPLIPRYRPRKQGQGLEKVTEKSSEQSVDS